MDENEKNKDDKWKFEDYAYTITGIIVGFLLVVPEILYSQFGISILGGSLGGDSAAEFADMLESGDISAWSISELRALSPLLFLLTTTICFFQEAVVARKTGGYKGSMFTHTFESLLEDAIYMAITTVMVFGAVLFGSMYMSWLAGPITWILFIFIWPFVKKKDDKSEEDDLPWVLLLLFVGGIIAELITGVWIAFPLAWIIICAAKFVAQIRGFDKSIDSVFEILYYAFSIILLGVGLTLDFWIVSWAAFPVALFICWLLSKTPFFKAP